MNMRWPLLFMKRTFCMQHFVPLTHLETENPTYLTGNKNGDKSRKNTAVFKTTLNKSLETKYALLMPYLGFPQI